jgi:hypothetical protein
MTTNKRALAIMTMLSMVLAITGCNTSTQTTTEPQTQPPAHPAPAPADVAPQQEDAAIFESHAADAVVPDALKNALQTAATTQQMRKFPYPYRGMLAFASDIDDSTPEEFAEYHRFLNTKEETPYGPGVGLDVGDTMWMYMGNNQPNVSDKEGHYLDHVMTYFDWTDPTKKRFAEQIQHYWKAGWIDSMHTFGDFSRKNTKDISFKRSLAVAAWEEMKKQGLNCEVWINHGNEANVDAFGAYNPTRFSKYQAGDDPNSPYYHTDLTIKNGVHYVWNSIGETTFGQDDPLFEISLRDGQRIWGFHRYTHEITKGKNDWTWVPREVHRQITKERLDGLVAKGQYAILGQHLGGYNIGFPFDEKGVKTLRMLADYQDQGKVLVAKTSRTLKYADAHRFVKYAVAHQDGETWLNILAIQDPLFGPQPLTLDNVRGLTFYVDRPEKTHLLLGMKPLGSDQYQVNPSDETGKTSIGVKWFAPDLVDHSKDVPPVPETKGDKHAAS